MFHAKFQSCPFLLSISASVNNPLPHYPLAVTVYCILCCILQIIQ
uniref:Uncharacterized protein n=1 Tax=Anguilla anguilla TaxID=7936 RepID=A0A0E9UZ30_ANGAN